MSQAKPCPICHNPPGPVVFKKESEGALWVRCEGCGLVYKVHERPEPGDSADYYRDGKMRETVPYRYGDSSSATPEAAFEEKYELQWERFLKAKGCLDKASSVLEIGCGSGGFLYIAAPNVERCVGVELDEELAAFCRTRLKLDVRDKPLNEIDFGGKEFDLICMFHVLEHFYDPGSFLVEAIKLLKPGGRLAIEVPCFDDALVQAFDLKKFQELYFVPHHELYFTQNSLSRLLGDSGLQFQFSSFNEYGLANHLNWLQNDSPVKGASRQSGRGYQVTSFKKTPRNVEFVNSLNPWLRRINGEYKDILASRGFFDTIFCMAQKG
ncbi:MAG: class I SAM-dependent methyltransferase [Nitrospinae bacterium]|nr:class I SAM-dependent methyltransferase [Nitrospinota bacterium]